MNRLCTGSFLDLFLFNRLSPHYFVLSALYFGEFNRLDGSIDRNLRNRPLFILYVNEQNSFESPWLCDVICIF